jgi:hypothetical protein
MTDNNPTYYFFGWKIKHIQVQVIEFYYWILIYFFLLNFYCLVGFKVILLGF